MKNKNVWILIICLIFVTSINLFAAYTVIQTKKSLVNNLDVYASSINAKLNQLDKLLTEASAIKQMFGWKVEELPDTFCVGDIKKSLQDGPFSLVNNSPDSARCYSYEFTKLNKMVKALELYFIDDEFWNGFYKAKIDMLKNGIPLDDINAAKNRANEILGKPIQKNERTK